MANAINTVKAATTIISGIAAKMLEDQMPFVRTISKEPAESYNQVNGFNPGTTINISKPARFLATSGADMTSNLQNITEERTPLTLSNQTNIGVSLLSQEIATDLSLKSWAKRVIAPAMSSIAQNIESSVLTTVMNSTWNQVGTAGTTTFDTDTMLSAREKLMKNLVPDDNLYALLDSTAMRSAVNARKGLFNKTEEVAKQYVKGYMGNADAFEYLESNLVPVHTRGTQAATGATVTTTLSGEGVATVNITGTSGGTLLVGDTFTIANVFAVHPITKVTQNYLQQFTVTANNTASGTAYTGVTFAPAIYTSASSGLQNVNSFPQGSAAIVFTGAASTGLTQNIAFHPSAIRFLSVPLVNPAGADSCSTATTKNGITVRVWQDSIILTDKRIMRMDVLWGVSVVRPEWVVRITA